MVSGPITSWQIERENVEAVTDFLFLSSKITADGDCSHEIRRQFLLGRKAMTNLGKGKSLSRVWLFATPWAIAYQAPPSMEFSSQEYCSGLPFPSPGDLPDPGIEPWSPALQADALLSEPPGKLWSSRSLKQCKGKLKTDKTYFQYMYLTKDLI